MHPPKSIRRRLTGLRAALPAALLAVALAACDAGGSGFQPVNTPGDPDACNVSSSLFVDGGVGKDGIPALTDPALVSADRATYLADFNRVIGFVVDGRAIAVPHNILWWHEIANFNFANLQLAVTYCPLTGSSMAFDRSTVGGGAFGVSGLLFQNNLTMYDRTTDESLWPQMNREAGCGPRTGTDLRMTPVMEMTWGGWKSLHPDTEVVTNATGFSRNYATSGYPYGDYETSDNPRLLVPMPIDERRLPKERVLGIPSRTSGMAFPFSALDAAGPYRAVHENAGGQAVVVFWDRAREGAMAYLPHLDGQPLTFEGRADGFYDTGTGSRWRLDGRAVAGPLAGSQLEPVAEAYVAFWFAWATFQPQTLIWQP